MVYSVVSHQHCDIQRFTHNLKPSTSFMAMAYTHSKKSHLEQDTSHTNIILITTKLFTSDVSISVRDLRQKKLFNSSSGSYHSSDVTWLRLI